jgi:hypothetical protein
MMVRFMFVLVLVLMVVVVVRCFAPDVLKDGFVGLRDDMEKGNAQKEPRNKIVKNAEHLRVEDF